MVKKPDLSNSASGVTTLVVLAIVITGLYFAKDILLPVALATLLSFVLTPLVSRLELLRLGRAASVVIVTGVAFSAIGCVGWLATNQVVALSTELPEYKDNLIAKIRTVRGAATDKLDEAKEALAEIGDELSEGTKKKQSAPLRSKLGNDWMPWLNTSGDGEKATKEEAISVKVVELPPSPLRQIDTWLGPLVAPLSTAGLVLVLVIFMLIKREDLRNRMIQICGASQLSATTEAIDDAAVRLSRYLRMQLLINVIYGVVVAAGLTLLGIPNAMLWGVFGLLLRFLPYVGPWIAAAMPIALSLAISDGWAVPLLTIALFVAMEVLVNNVLEPWLYGSSAGVSSFGVILAAIFWAWLWGPIGLVLAMPLTVCLVVLGKYIPQLAFLSVLLGDRSSLQLHEQLYQRLLTADDVEALPLVEQRLVSTSLVELYDEVMIPTLHLAETDRHAGRLSEQQESEFLESARELVNDLGDLRETTSGAQDLKAGSNSQAGRNRPRRVLCLPARDQADETAASMLGQVLTQNECSVEIGSLDLLAGEIAERVCDERFDAVVLAALPPFGSRNCRYLCKRLRQRNADVNIIIALLHGQKLKKAQRRLLESGANTIATSLGEVAQAVKQAAPPRIVGETKPLSPTARTAIRTESKSQLPNNQLERLSPKDLPPPPRAPAILACFAVGIASALVTDIVLRTPTSRKWNQ